MHGGEAGEHLEWVEVASEDELRAWFLRNHAQDAGIWLVTYKKLVPESYIPHDAILDCLIAFGWTDGIMRRIDDDRTRQLVSPRRTTAWAKSYKDRAMRLMAEHRMHPSGLAAVESAMATGGWDAMNEVDELVMPDDLRDALDRGDGARRHFDTFPPSMRRSIFRWISSAKKAATRLRRIDLTVSEARDGRAVKSHG